MARKENPVQRAVRLAGGMTAAQLAMRCSYWTLREWLRRGEIPNLGKGIRLAQVSGVAIEDLAGDDDHEVAEKKPTRRPSAA